MHVVIMGCGRVGAALAQHLSTRDHSVSVIDKDPEAFRRLGPDFDGQSVTGMGFDRRTLSEAGLGRASAFAAVSSGDNSNIISARVAREVYGVKTVVARIYDSGRAEVYERLGIPTVATVRWTADRFLQHLLPKRQPAVWNDPSAEVALVEAPIHPDWAGRQLHELELAAGGRAACVTRFGAGIVPGPETVLQDGDRVFLATPAAHADRARAAAADRTEQGAELCA